MNSLNKIDLHYSGVDIEYDYITDCEQHGCDDICRCGEIHNETITEIDLNVLVKRIYDNYYGVKQTLAEKRDSKILEVLSGVGKDINLYCIDRIVKHFKLWETDYYNIEKEYGYYGEELTGVFLHENLAKKVEAEIEYVSELSSIDEKIEYLLLLEYGQILPQLEGCKFEVKEVQKSDVIFGSTAHHNKVKGKALDFYSDSSYDNIRGVAIADGSKFRLIDGYHRTHTTNKTNVKLIIATKCS